MKIIIETIPHDQQRYETCGDWLIRENGDIQIFVSAFGSPMEEALVGLHEAHEALMCIERGITQEQVDKFDMEFEANRQPEDESEPGDDPSAPYHEPHGIATGIERIMAAALHTPWKTYEGKINALFNASLTTQKPL